MQRHHAARLDRPGSPGWGRAAGARRVGSRCAAAARAPVDWEAKRKQRLAEDLVAGARRAKAPMSQEAVAAGIEQLEGLIPGFQISPEAMKAADWLKLVADPAAAAVRLVALKQLYPRADLSRVLRERPVLMLHDVTRLEEDGRQVRQLLASARDADALITALPMLLDPRTLMSVLITVDKWYFGAQDPVEVLENDPEMLIRAMACDVPLEPVFDNPDGTMMVPSFNYKEKRADWQAHIDKTQPRLHWGSSGTKSML